MYVRSMAMESCDDDDDDDTGRRRLGPWWMEGANADAVKANDAQHNRSSFIMIAWWFILLAARLVS